MRLKYPNACATIHLFEQMFYAAAKNQKTIKTNYLQKVDEYGKKQI